ncbi:hypothetical protein BDZ94DRAFT_450554 [Collybia nuda]|uniref:Uncharacterized protein n=1 Tax=Collybia nuda TaxID=64659 RepID=A0A9P5Y9S9_9AGAR|nr:hypothetical protein BDZ94DRAFT_450554 [Collybia nuda]
MNMPVPSNSTWSGSTAATSGSHSSASHHPIPTHSRNPHILTTFLVPTLITITHSRPLIEPTHAKDRGPGSRGNPTGGHRQSRQQKPIIIFFEVLCGTVIFGILVCLLRCCYSYKRTPSHDRVMGVVNRYRLQQELEDLERNPLARRHGSIDEPAPPYLPRPPSYISLVEPPPLRPTTQTNAINYIEMSTTSSPPIRRGSLEVLMPRISHPPNILNG